MRPFSSQSEPAGLFDGTLARGEVRLRVADDAWLAALLEVEAALARAAAVAGAIPAEAGALIAAACVGLDPPIAELSTMAAASGNPVVPLVTMLRTAVGAELAPYVHIGATSQDIMDSAAMLVARRALVPLLADLRGAADAAARLARAHRDTPMAGRTLLRQAVPTTFGLKAAGWTVALDEAAQRLDTVRATRLAAQYGGAAGTRAGLDTRGTWPADPDPAGTGAASTGSGSAGTGTGSAGTGSAGTGSGSAGTGTGPGSAGTGWAGVGEAVARGLAAELGLAYAVLPWHTDRTRIAELAGALGIAAGVAAKVARDVTLLSQDEVAEVSEGAPGGSSAMPHKRNAVAAISTLAGAVQAPGLVATLLAAMAHEHERAAGSWHAEWRPLRELLIATGSAASWLRECLTHLDVHPAAMRANLSDLLAVLAGDLDVGDAAVLVDAALSQRVPVEMVL